MEQARLSHSHCIWKMHVLEWNDTDDAFEVDGDGDGADDRLDDELSKTVEDEDARGDSWVNPFIFFLWDKGGCVGQWLFPEKKHLHNLTNM